MTGTYMTGCSLNNMIDRMENHGYKYFGHFGDFYKFVNRRNYSDCLFFKSQYKLQNFLRIQRW